MDEGVGSEDPAALNALWAELSLEELHRLGVRDLCMAPGSRSTPLALAAARHPGIRATVHFDERGCAFHALGMARAHGRPVAVLCTSGSAAANLLPAVVEAAMDGLPLVLLTADRPPELRDAGANQTIHQPGLFGVYVRWEADLPVPSTTFPAAALLTTLDQAVHRSLAWPPGPVHLNMPFREPLSGPSAATARDDWDAPLRRWRAGSAPFTRHHRPRAEPRPAADEPLAAVIRGARRGLLVVGRLKGRAETEAAAAVATTLGWPAVADIGSGLRLGRPGPPWLHHFDLLLQALPQAPEAPDVVLHLGGGLVSRRLLEHLAGARPEHYLRVGPDPRRQDPAHQVSEHLEIPLEAFAAAVAALHPPPPPAAWVEAWRSPARRLEQALAQALEATPALDEPAVCRLVSRLLPADGALFLAASMPVRDMDGFADPGGSAVPVGSNRGASGIDGTVATACGYAAGLGRPTALVCGDLALLHDLNSLALLRSSPVPLTVVVINNDGGGIFSFLPVAAESEHFETYFATPHGLGFEDFARGFGLRYHRPAGTADFARAFGEAMATPHSSLIEVRSERDANLRRHREIVAGLRAALAPAASASAPAAT